MPNVVVGPFHHNRIVEEGRAQYAQSPWKEKMYFQNLTSFIALLALSTIHAFFISHMSRVVSSSLHEMCGL